MPSTKDSPWSAVVVQAMLALLAVIGAIVLVLALPLIIPIAMVEHWLSTRRKRRDAENTCCGACGRTLGRKALDLADTAFDSRAASGRETHLGMRFRVIRTVHAICAFCGARYRYEGRAFQRLVATEVSGVAASSSCMAGDERQTRSEWSRRALRATSTSRRKHV